MTYACNLKCKHCYLGNDINNVQTYFTFERARKVIDQLDQIGVIEINFTGGELFANKDALRIIEYACSKNFIINILTNGTLVTEEIINKLTELPISGVRISMYGMKEFHDNFVGVKGAFDKSLQTLIRLNEKKKNFCAASSVVTKESIDSLLQLRHLLEKSGIRHRLTPMIFPTTYGDLSPTELRISEEEIVNLFEEGVFEYSGSSCNSGISRLRINPYGEVNPCELFRDVSFGNIFEKSMEEILQSDTRKVWISNVQQQMKLSECRNCSIRKYCPRCLGVSYLETGDLKKKTEGLCVMARAKARSMKKNQ